MTVAGYSSIFGQHRTANHVYIAATMDAAMWSAELASCAAWAALQSPKDHESRPSAGTPARECSTPRRRGPSLTT